MVIAARFQAAARYKQSSSPKNSEVDMRTSLLASLIVALGIILISVGPAAADSFIEYPDSTVSRVVALGGGSHGFVLFDFSAGGDLDIFVHPVNAFSDLQFVSLAGFVGFALWLDFEGTSGPFLVYGVYTCLGSSFSCSFGSRRGTLLL